MGKSEKTNPGKKRIDVLGTVTMVVSRLGIRIALYALVAILFYFGITKAYSFGYRVFTAGAVSVEPGTDILVIVKDGMSHKDVAELLEMKGLVKDHTVFLVQAELYTSSSYDIQPGTYTLNTSQTPKEMIEIMTVKPETEEETTALALGIEPETEEDKAGAADPTGESNGQ